MQRGAVDLRGQALLVERVAELVHDRADVAEGALARDAGGEAHVAGVRRAGERVRRAGDHARRRLEAHQRGDVVREGHLPVLGPVAGRQLGRLARRGRLHDRRQPLAQLGEDRLEAGRAGARLELVEQGVVGLVADADRLGLAALQLDHAAQRLGVGGEVVGRPGLDPRRHAARAGLGDLAHQRLGHAQGPVALAGRQAQHRARVVVQGVAVVAQGRRSPHRRRAGRARGGAGRRACRAGARGPRRRRGASGSRGPSPAAPPSRRGRRACRPSRRRAPIRVTSVPAPADSSPRRVGVSWVP